MLAANYLVWLLSEVVAVGILVALFVWWRPGFLGGKTIRQTAADALEARQAQIKEQLESAQRSREEAARIREQAAQDIDAAHRESVEIVERAGHTSDAIKDEMRKRAQEEYDRIVGQAKSEIDLERERAELALRRRAADIVVDSAGQIIGRDLQPQADRRLIDQSLDDLDGLR